MFSIFQNHSEIIAQISQKSDGSMLVSGGSAEMVENQQKYYKKLGIKPEQVISAGLVHGNKIVGVEEKDGGKIIPETDALITREKNLVLTVTAADCLPVFFYDPMEKIVGIAHAGWQGLWKEILTEMVSKFQAEYESRPEDILVGIGPGICAKHYDVSEERADHFKNYPKEVIIKRNGKTYLDLKKSAEIQLIKSGILEKNIEISPECTFEEAEKYFSFRRDKPKVVEAMLAGMGFTLLNKF